MCFWIVVFERSNRLAGDREVRRPHVSRDARARVACRYTDQNYPIASRIIADSIDAGLIKKIDPESESKKFAAYVPHRA
jgi:hypothetical protein